MRRFFFGLAVFALAAPTPLWADTTDRQIAQQIVKELKCQKDCGQLKGFNLDLQVVDGSVFLRGFVSEREQRRQAVEAARGVAGVKQVYNEIEIKSAEDASPQLLDAPQQIAKIAPAPPLEVRLASTRKETPPAPPQVAVEVTPEDEAFATGAAPSATDREIGRLLEAVVRDPIAEAPVVNEAVAPTGIVTQAPVNVFRTPQLIAVSHDRAMETSEVAPSAREITQTIVDQYRSAMERGELKGFGIDVHVDRGIVTLQGTVADPAQAEYAIEVASNAAGVVKVVDALRVASSVTQTPEAQTPEARLVSHDGLDEGVQHAFRQESSGRGKDGDAERLAKQVIAGLQQQKEEGLLANFGIDVRVDQRIVRLSGYVQDAQQHARALDVARFVPGVLVVVDDLQVQNQNMSLRPVAQETPLNPVAAALPQAMPLQQAPGQPMYNYQMVPVQYVPAQTMQAANQTPMAFAPARPINYTTMQDGQPVPMTGNAGVGIAPARFDHPQMPGYAWPSYAAHPNYGAVTYPKQYSPSAWPYIGPFYPYPQVPLGWRRVTLEWDDGWWNLKFKNTHMH